MSDNASNLYKNANNSNILPLFQSKIKDFAQKVGMHSIVVSFILRGKGQEKGYAAETITRVRLAALEELEEKGKQASELANQIRERKD